MSICTAAEGKSDKWICISKNWDKSNVFIVKSAPTLFSWRTDKKKR